MAISLTLIGLCILYGTCGILRRFFSQTATVEATIVDFHQRRRGWYPIVKYEYDGKSYTTSPDTGLKKYTYDDIGKKINITFYRAKPGESVMPIYIHCGYLAFGLILAGVLWYTK